jgi:hypothetical protein
VNSPSSVIVNETPTFVHLPPTVSLPPIEAGSAPDIPRTLRSYSHALPPRHALARTYAFILAVTKYSSHAVSYR